MSTRAGSTQGFTLVELIITVAIVGVISAIGFLLLPRQNMAMNQAQRIAASGLQFARFEAIKRNEPVTANLVVGAAEVVVVRTNDGSVLRRFELDPQSDRVVIKSVGPNGAITFNARGVATTPVERDLTLGIASSAGFDRDLVVSGQGAISEVP